VISLLTAVLITIIDQLCKVWITSYPEGYVIFHTGYLRVIHSQNTGAAFGIFQNQRLALTIVAFIGITFILIFTLRLLRRLPSLDNKLVKSALGLILGGTLGNLIDRLRLGHITDFIDLHFWPVFNIADSASVVGAIILACFLLYLTIKERR